MRNAKNLLILTVIGPAAMALGQVDNVVTVINPTNATAGKTIGTFGYDPTTDTAYVGSFGFTAPGTNSVYRKVENVSGVQNSIGMLTEAQAQLYYRDGDPDRSVTNPTPSALLLNPMQIGTGPSAIPAYSTAVISDISITRFPGTSTTDPAATKRIYRWNLQAPPAPSPTPPPFGDGRDVFTTISTLADFQAAASATSISNNIGRQFVYSGDGQSIYALDISTAFGGIYKINLVDNTEVRIAAFDDPNSEPAMISSGGVDTIFFGGGGTVTNNSGGIDSITHDGTTTGARTVAVAAATLNEFWESTAGSGSFNNLTTDAAGNLYFSNVSTTTNRRGMYKLDTEGRLAKIVGYEDRKVAIIASPNSAMLRPQARTIDYAGPGGTYSLTQILYMESSGANVVAGANVFKTGDFDRDNDVDQDDVVLFKSALTLRGVALTAANAADHPKFKFDLNGNNEVSYKDVKILQQFYGFANGDADINEAVNLDDFTALAANFGLTGKKWTEGDFTGDEAVTLDDFTILAANFGLSPSSTARPAVPEPMGISALLGTAFLLRRRR